MLKGFVPRFFAMGHQSVPVPKVGNVDPSLIKTSFLSGRIPAIISLN